MPCHGRFPLESAHDRVWKVGGLARFRERERREYLNFSLCKDDLAADGFLVELAHGDDVVDLVDEVVFGETEQIDLMSPKRLRPGLLGPALLMGT
jgi:hypothetical protein